MTDERTAAIPVDPFPDPVLAYAVGGRDARITTTNASLERQFGDVSPESFVPTGFDRCSHSTTTGNYDPITHVVRGDRVGIYLDNPENRRTFLARVIPSGDGTGYLVFSDPEDCPTTEKLPAVDQVGTVGSRPTVTADADRVRRLFENLFRNAIEHGATGNRANPGDSVEHNATDGPSQADDNIEHRSTDNRTRSGDSVNFGSDAPAPDTHGDRGERSPGTREQSHDRSEGTTSEGSLTVTVGALSDGFYVADDGTGIPADERETVFEPGHSSMNGGTGLGLAIVEQIITAHDWNVTLTTADCGGARFEIRF
jgi:hypothetical protein